VIYPYLLYVGIRERNRTWILLGIFTTLLASLAHPVSILLLGGPAIWLLVRYLRPSNLRQMWTRPAFRWAVAGVGVLVLLIASRFVVLLQNWIAEHDMNPGAGGQFLNWIPGTPGVKQVAIVLAYLESLTVPVAVGGMAGIYLLWREQRGLGLFLASVALFPIAFLTLLSLRTPVSQYYLLPTTPVFLLGAGVFLDRVSRLQWRMQPPWLVPATLAAIFVASATPTLISDLRDGRRFDFRGAAQWLQPQVTPGDMVFSDQYMVLRHYLPGSQVQKLRKPAPLAEALQDLQQRQGNGAVWVVAPAPSHPFRSNLKRGGLIAWVYDHCQLRHSRGVGRVDLRQHYLQVYRCPPVDLPRNQPVVTTRER
jgi:hypothetical protein